MKNIDIIKYLINNDVERFAELLVDIYAKGWNDGIDHYFGRVIVMENWLDQNASDNDFGIFRPNELEEWSKRLE